MKNLKSPRATEAEEKFQEQLEKELSEYNQDDQDFIKTVAAFSRNLEADSLSTELQKVFFKIADSRSTLPEMCPLHIVDSFLAILISLISVQKDKAVTIKSI
jgi:hypothetical protein